MSNSAKVFITTYSIYNQGKQFASDKHGFWLDVSDLNFDDLTENFNEVDPICTNDHEFMFTDYEGFPESLYSESGMNFDAISEYDDLEESEKELVSLLLDHGCVCDISDAIKKVSDGECYIFDGDLADYARDITEQCNNIPDHLQNYIDYNAMGRDMSYDGNLIEINHDKLLVICF